GPAAQVRSDQTAARVLLVLVQAQVTDPPPLRTARRHSWPFAPDGVVDRREQLGRLLGRDEPRRPCQFGQLAECVGLVRHLELAGPGGESVTEAAVDRLFRGPQRSDRLLTLVDVA